MRAMRSIVTEDVRAENGSGAFHATQRQRSRKTGGSCADDEGVEEVRGIQFKRWFCW
jgi:hypothetical protein